MRNQFRVFALSVLVTFALAGCGGGSSNNNVTPVSTSSSGGTSSTSTPLITSTTVDPVGARTLIVTEPTAITVGEDTVDAVDVIGFDAQGNQVYNSRADFANTMTFTNVPSTADTVELDYLRNHGFALKTFNASLLPSDSAAKPDVDSETVTLSSVTLNNPHEHSVDETTKFFSEPDGKGGFKMKYTYKGVTKEIKFKAIAYSPSPIGYDVQQNDALNDVFWDDYKTESGAQQNNWYGLWGVGQLYQQFYAREDLNRMRDLGCNSIRVYAMIAKQIPSKYADENKKFPDYHALGHHFTHKKFLDMCWNNGNKPLFVLADIPMPDHAFLPKSAALPGEVAWWEANFAQSITDLHDHPAIIGFNMMNERDAEYAFAPKTGPDANTDYFYGEGKKLADLEKSLAPDKLIGWAFHDGVLLPFFMANNASKDPQFASLGKYGNWLKNFDFWGVNVYQTINYDNELSPTLKIVDQGGNVVGMTYAELPDDMKKPVLFTELGFPCVARDGDNFSTDQSVLDAAEQKSANLVTRMMKQAYGDDPNSRILCGTFFFSFSNEWWKSGKPTVFNPTLDAAFNDSFPTGYDDQEAYGLYAVKRGAGKINTDPITDQFGNPLLPLDDLTPRAFMVKAVKDIYTKN